MPRTPPNILFLQTDQLTPFSLKPYGDPICLTPHIDRLAAEGLLFENAYCNFPLCAPSRFSMASGRLASRIGAFDNAAEFPASIPTYAHYLRKAGYQTCLSGKMHFVGPDQLHGFERRLTSDLYPSDFEWTADWTKSGFEGATDISMLQKSGQCARSVQIDYDEDVAYQAIGALYDFARSPDSRPFFLQVSFTHPHDPYLCTPDMWDRYDGLEIPMPAVDRPSGNENDPHSVRLLQQHGLYDAEIDPEMIGRARQAYYGSLSFIDDKVGAVLHALHGAGFSNNTVIVFTSDHGEMLGERGLWLKKTFFEPALRVPLILHWPEELAPGRSEALCSLLDLLPTFMGIATDGQTLDPVDPLDGDDLLALTRSGSENRPIYAELLSEGVPAPTFMIRRDRWKYIANGVDPDLLFDLQEDPMETHNRAVDPACADILSSFTTERQNRWDSDALTREILASQKRRLFIRDAMKAGTRNAWDFIGPTVDDGKWFRGQTGYNDWAFDFLPVPGGR
ncbi:MAG: choline-sulfatase [Pseudomonadota bacterium]